MKDKENVFANTAIRLSHNPIGIIGLFLVLVDGIAALVIIKSNLQPQQNSILVGFIVLFPIVVLGAFYRLVTQHHEKLYSPSDYKDEGNFVKTMARYDYLKAKEIIPYKEVESDQLIEVHKSKKSEVNSKKSLQIRESEVAIDEIQTISTTLNHIVEMQKSILEKIKDNNTEDDSEIIKLKENIEKGITVDIPKVILKRKYMQYNVHVCDMRGAKQLVSNMRANGFNASIYHSEIEKNKFSRREESEAIWLGKNVPVEVAIPIIRLGIKHFPHIKYIGISGDMSEPPEEVHNEIFIGGATSTAKEEGLKEWSKEDFSKFSENMSQLDFHAYIRMFYS